MKKILYILSFIPFLALAQSQDQNYVKSTTYKQPTASKIPTPTIEQANVQVTYYDGLGRPIQQIAHKQSASGKDIVAHIEYDQFGRQIKDYLPFVKTASLDYLDANSAFSEINSFYSSYNGGTSNPYSEKQLESSPLNRVFKQAAPGDNWAMNSGHAIQFDYQTNEDDDEVKHFIATATAPLPLNINDPYEISIVQNAFYTENQLYKTKTKDENWTSGNNNTTQEFKNKQGQVILKRTFSGTDIFDTYYVYDQFSNLTYVIPPLAEGNPTIDNLEKLCYQYKYDSRNRLVEKKIPGKQWEFIVYNKVNLPVATGPSLNPFDGLSQGWMITKYDALSRPVYTGWYNGQYESPTSAGRKIFQSKMNNLNSSWYVSTYNSTLIIDNISIMYNNAAYPNDDIPYKLLTINYYDNYNFPHSNLIDTNVTGVTLATNVKGMQTGSWVRVLEGATSTNAEISYTLYDTKYRPVRSYTQNYLGGFTQVDSDLDDFNGKVLSTKTTHKRTANDTPLVITETFEYTAQDRLYKHKHQINSQPEEIITENYYDELGQLTTKNTGTDLQEVNYQYNVRGWLTAINEEETAQSENGYVQLGSGDLFAFKISYDNLLNSIGNTTPLFNGNISETFWITSTDNTVRQYGYEYDKLNRLEKAKFIKDPFAGGDEEDAFNESLIYDKNGNITNLFRTGKIQSGDINEIDNLTYSYDGNQLKGVTDATNSPQGFNDGNTSGADYFYDANGNLTKDKNKDIQTITYNHLNLPIAIEFGNGNRIIYIYNAVGQKVNKDVKTGQEYANTDYLNGFQYRSSYTQAQGNQGTKELLYFPMTEGYVNKFKDDFHYVYHYTDHLGNIRLSYTLDPESGLIKIMEENHYYPFGLKHEFYNTATMKFAEKMAPNTNESMIVLEQANNFVGDGSYNYKYQGQERQDELGLNWDSFKWRNYDYAIGRFMSIDPLAEKYAYNSTYAFQENKMGMGRELEGLELITFAQMRTYFTAIKYAFIGKTEQARSNLKTSINNRLEVSITGKEKNNISVSSYNVNKVSDYGNMATSVSIIEKEALKTTKTVVRDGADVLEKTGDGITAVGIVTAQPEIVAIGETVSTTGSIINAGLDLSEGKSVESVATDFAISEVFGQLSKSGVKASRTVAGEEYVKQGKNKVTEAIIEGNVKVGEKIVDEIRKE
jgi:RHS repeat-associated protein